MLSENPEQLTAPLNIKLTPSMKANIEEYAKRHKVSQAVAVRHMIDLVLSGDFRKSEHCCNHTEGEKTA